MAIYHSETKTKNIRWRAIVHHYRFKAVVTSWEALCTFALKTVLRADFFAHLGRKLRSKIHKEIGVSFKSFVRKSSKTILNSVSEIRFSSLLKIRAKIKHYSIVAVKFQSLIKNKIMTGAGFSTCVGFIAAYRRRRNLRLALGVEAGVSSCAHKYGRLSFDNRKNSVVTVGLLKQLSTAQLKDRNLARWKQDLGIVPQFEIVFSADIRKK